MSFVNRLLYRERKTEGSARQVVELPCSRRQRVLQ